jgi:hypothetical protein
VRYAKEIYFNDFGGLIVFTHMVTEEHLSKYYWQYTESEVRVCQQLSRYMMYLLVTHPDLLPLTKGALTTLDERKDHGFRIRMLMRGYYNGYPDASPETLKGFKDMWTEIFTYAAARSRPEVHATLLGSPSPASGCCWLICVRIHKEFVLLCWPGIPDLMVIFFGR